MLENLTVILFKPKYPENIGSVARACLNMGCGNIILVAPQMFDMEKALPLATAHARHLLENARITDTLEEAIQGFNAVYGTTARTGGWRKGIMTPADMAEVTSGKMRMGGSVALVFGPEDRGLTNDETQLCTGLVTIPTSRENSSLNLSQAVLILLYECLKLSLDAPFTPAGPPEERLITMEEQEVLFGTIRQSLLDIDYLRDTNTDYWMLPVRRFMAKINLRRNEFNLLMGICRQIRWIAGRNK